MFYSMIALYVLLIGCSISSYDALDTKVSSSTTSSPLSHFNNEFVVLLQQQKVKHEVDHQVKDECVPCSDSDSSDSNSDSSSTSLRKLQLLNRVSDTLLTLVDTNTTDVTSNTTNTTSEIDDIVVYNDIFGNMTVIELFQMIFDDPELRNQVVMVALLIILPLIALEAESITTQTPIICILGGTNTPFLGPCSNFERRHLLRVQQQQHRHLQNDTFLQSYFPNGTIESIRIPSFTTNETILSNELDTILTYGLSGGVSDMLRNVTIVDVVTVIANNTETIPFLSTTLFVLYPIVMFDSLTRITNTPISCIVNPNCRRRNLQIQVTNHELEEQEQLSVCEMEYMVCEMDHMLTKFGF